MKTSVGQVARVSRSGQLVAIVVSVLVSLGLSVAAGANAGAAQAAPAPDTPGCYLSLNPPSGPVGTLVSITGSSATCNDGGEGGEFGFFDEYAAVFITELPAAGPFAFDYRIPVTMASGQFDSAVLGYEGGGPVGPGPAGFLTNMGAPLDAAFDVTSAPPGWADYTSIMAATKVCNGCTSSVVPVYDIVRSDGYLDTLGPTIAVGNAGGLALKAPIVGSAITSDAGGYWMVGADGGVFSFGDAGFYGSLPTDDVTPAGPIVGIAPAADGKGYWLVGADGGVFSFGDAGFYGSMGGEPLNAPVVAMAATPDGYGYWVAAADGGVFTFGDAPFEGSAASGSQQFAMVAMTPSSSGKGCWLLGQDGGVFTFGDATFLGSGRGGPGQGAPTS